jgi:hypothetical protein
MNVMRKSARARRSKAQQGGLGLLRVGWWNCIGVVEGVGLVEVGSLGLVSWVGHLQRHGNRGRDPQPQRWNFLDLVKTYMTLPPPHFSIILTLHFRVTYHAALTALTSKWIQVQVLRSP